MKSFFTVLLFSISSICSAQWEQLGQEIFGETGDSFTGTSVAMNGDGDVVAVYDSFINETDAGRVRVFELQNNVWTQIGDDIPGLLGDGQSDGRLQMNATGTHIILGNSTHQFNGDRSGGVRVFELQSGAWVQLGDTLFGADQEYFYGIDVGINAEGNTIIIGSNQGDTINPEPGFAEVFEFNNNNWASKGQRIVGSAQSEMTGTSVSISDNGDIIAVASPNNDTAGSDSGKVEIFEFTNNSWTLKGNPIYGENAEDVMGSCNVGGSAIDLNGNGMRLAISSIGHIQNNLYGQVRVFEFQNAIWNQLGASIFGPAESSSFGQSVELNNLGNVVVIGAPFEGPVIAGSARVFKQNGSNWTQVNETLSSPNGGEATAFGWCTAINDLGNKIAVGIPLKEVSSNDVGSVIVYENDSILSTPTLNSSEFGVQLFPNPNNGSFSLNFSKTLEKASINISEVSGKVLFSELYKTLNKIELAENLDSGIYFVNVKTKSSEATLKMIVQ